MEKAIIDQQNLVNIANAIREKNGSADRYKPSEMSEAISDIEITNLRELEVTPSTATQEKYPQSPYNGFSKVTVGAVTKNIDKNIKPENIIKGVTILGVEGSADEIHAQDNVFIEPTTYDQEIEPLPGYNAFKKVSVAKVDENIDINIQPQNIKSGVTILGTEGELEPINSQSVQASLKTVEQTILPDADHNTLSAVTIPALTVQSVEHATGETGSIAPENIRRGVSILGVVGTVGADTCEVDNIVPTKSTIEVTPPEGYDAMTKVTVKPIPSQYIIPSGTRTLYSNDGGYYDITHYAGLNLINNMISTSVRPTEYTQYLNRNGGYSSVIIEPIPSYYAPSALLSTINVYDLYNGANTEYLYTFYNKYKWDNERQNYTIENSVLKEEEGYTITKDVYYDSEKGIDYLKLNAEKNEQIVKDKYFKISLGEHPNYSNGYLLLDFDRELLDSDAYISYTNKFSENIIVKVEQGTPIYLDGVYYDPSKKCKVGSYIQLPDNIESDICIFIKASSFDNVLISGNVSLYSGTRLQTKTVYPTKETINVTPDSGYLGLNKVTVNPIPAEYIVPRGNIRIYEDGDYDITEYKSLRVMENGIQMDCEQIYNSPLIRNVYDGQTIIAQYNCYFTENNLLSTYGNDIIGGWFTKQYIDDELLLSSQRYGTNYYYGFYIGKGTNFSAKYFLADLTAESENALDYVYVCYSDKNNNRIAKKVDLGNTFQFPELTGDIYLLIGINSGSDPASARYSGSIYIYGGTTKLQVKATIPTKQEQEISYELPYTGLEKVIVRPIPDEYIIPDGSIEITENGIYDVTDKESVDVDVEILTQDKEVTITNNGVNTYSYDSGFNGLNTIKVTTNVQPELQDKEISPSQEQQIITADTGYYGLNTVIVDAIENQEKSDIIHVNGEYDYIPDEGYEGLSRIHIVADIAVSTQELEATPYESQQEILPDTGYDGFNKVTISEITINNKTVSQIRDILDNIYQGGN